MDTITKVKKKRNKTNCAMTIASWKNPNAPNLTAERHRARAQRDQYRERVNRLTEMGAERAGPGVTVQENWMAETKFAVRKGLVLGEGSARRLVEHPPERWRHLESRLYFLSRVHQLDDWEISAKLEVAVEDFAMLRSIAGCAQLPNLERRRK